MTAPAASAERSSDTRLHGRRLALARLAWLAIAVLALGLLVASIPPSFQHLRTVCAGDACASEQLTPARVQALHNLGLSADYYAAHSIALTLVFALVCGVTATTIVVRKADDWLALLTALMLMTSGSTIFGDFGALAESAPAWWLPIQFVAFIGQATTMLFFFLFPTGRFVPRWTRAVAVLWIAWTAPEYFLPTSPFNPFNEAFWPPLLSNVVFMGFVGAFIVAQLHRYRRVSDPVQRQQTKWVVFGATAAGGGFLALLAPMVFFPSLEQNVLIALAVETAMLVCLLLIPLSIGMAILRSRLWDIDLVINRTLVYGLLTAALAGVYFGGVAMLQGLFRALIGQDSDVAIVAATLAVAALFLPLRRRIQVAIDRRFYRRKYDAAAILAAFSAALRDDADFERVSAGLLGVVRETVQPAHASLWWREPEEIR
jgi:hypothetical protein